MTIQYTFKKNGKMLEIKAWGFDDDLEDVLNYNRAVLAAVHKYEADRVLSDERELEYRLGTLDTFELAKFAAEHAPGLGKVAIVFHPEHLADAAFYETVAVNRGMMVKAFQDYDAALAWVKEN